MTLYSDVKQDFNLPLICEITFKVSAMHESNATDYGRKAGFKVLNAGLYTSRRLFEVHISCLSYGKYQKFRYSMRI